MGTPWSAQAAERKLGHLIDTHCHLVPQLDDGPATSVEAVALASALVRDGITAVVCTPHYSRRFTTNHARALAALEALDAELAARGIALRTRLGAEMGPDSVVSASDEDLETRAIAGRYLLVEVQPLTPAGFLDVAGARLAELGLVPIFAHPERSRAIQREPNIVDAARRDGALMQVVAPSLLGRWGDGAEAAAWRLLETARGDLVASDAHGSLHRRPHLREAAALIEERYGVEARLQLTETTPSLVLEGFEPDRRSDPTS